MSIGLNRDTTDKFYTNKEIVEICINNIKSNIKIKKTDFIIEPSAGNGAFIEEINKMSKFCLFLDIKPENNQIEECDYLNFKISEYKKYNNLKPNKKIHVIGNPPFGRQSSLAIKFIKKSCEFSDTLSFILPKSFKKDSLKKHFPLNFHLIYESDLPKYSFNIESNKTDKIDTKYDIDLSNSNERIKHDVPCIFQIWIKKDTERKVEEKLKPINFTFIKKDQNPDISFRRVGGTAGFVDKDYENKNIESHNFIKFNDDIKKKITIDKIVIELNNIKYNFNNTVGPKSISKQEIIKNIEFVLNKLIQN
jgi:hypothetical protein